MRIITISIISLFGSTLSLRAAVDLYLQPTLDDAPIATVDLYIPSLSEGFPVLDDNKAALGWQWAEYTNTMDGYIPDAKIGKDLLPVNGALIRLAPSEEATVLTAVQAGDEIEIIDTGEWWTVRFTKAIPVYYIEETPAALAPVVIVENVESDNSDAMDVPLSEEQSLLELYENSMETYSQESSQASPATGLRQQFEGTLIRTKSRLGIFEPEGSFELVDSLGRRIGLVDLSQLVTPGSLDRYLGMEVIVHGSRSFDGSGGNVTIHAQNMRLK